MNILYCYLSISLLMDILGCFQFLLLQTTLLYINVLVFINEKFLRNKSSCTIAILLGNTFLILAKTTILL